MCRFTHSPSCTFCISLSRSHPPYSASIMSLVHSRLGMRVVAAVGAATVVTVIERETRKDFAHTLFAFASYCLLTFFISYFSLSHFSLFLLALSVCACARAHGLGHCTKPMTKIFGNTCVNMYFEVLNYLFIMKST